MPDVVNRIFQLVRSRTYRSSITDKYMWDFIKLVISETPESYVMLIFNFIMTNIISLINPHQNPIPFIISAVDRSIGWMMRTIYKDKTIYGEVYGGVEDLYGSSLTKESFYFHCCADVISKASNIGMQILEENKEDFEKIKARLDQVTSLFPVTKLITLPIASEILEVPYKQLITIPPKHAVLIGIFMHKIALEIGLDQRFPVITNFLSMYSIEEKKSNSKSMYNIRNLEFIINNTKDDDTPKPMWGFKSPILKFKVLKLICGALSSSKRNLIDIETGRQINRLTYTDLENDVCSFFIEFYSKSLDPTFEKMRAVSDTYFS